MAGWERVVQYVQVSLLCDTSSPLQSHTVSTITIHGSCLRAFETCLYSDVTDTYYQPLGLRGDASFSFLNNIEKANQASFRRYPASGVWNDPPGSYRNTLDLSSLASHFLRPTRNVLAVERGQDGERASQYTSKISELRYSEPQDLAHSSMSPPVPLESVPVYTSDCSSSFKNVDRKDSGIGEMEDFPPRRSSE
jgi:hypothetical protein